MGMDLVGRETCMRLTFSTTTLYWSVVYFALFITFSVVYLFIFSCLDCLLLVIFWITTNNNNNIRATKHRICVPWKSRFISHFMWFIKIKIQLSLACGYMFVSCDLCSVCLVYIFFESNRTTKCRLFSLYGGISAGIESYHWWLLTQTYK